MCRTGAAVVPVLIAAPEALTEIVTVLVQINIVPVIPVGRVLIGVAIAVIGAPPVLSVRLARARTFLVNPGSRPAEAYRRRTDSPGNIYHRDSSDSCKANRRKIGCSGGAVVLTQSFQILLLNLNCAIRRCC